MTHDSPSSPNRIGLVNLPTCQKPVVCRPQGIDSANPRFNTVSDRGTVASTIGKPNRKTTHRGEKRQSASRGSQPTESTLPNIVRQFSRFGAEVLSWKLRSFSEDSGSRARTTAVRRASQFFGLPSIFPNAKVSAIISTVMLAVDGTLTATGSKPRPQHDPGKIATSNTT